jgi:peptidoglycan hydrolase-like protein with peptidoglycan-binding domain
MRTFVLQAVQQRLIARDLLPDSSADGIFGEQTAEALAAFQEQAGLQVTGMPDAWTVFVLTAMDGQP